MHVWTGGGGTGALRRRHQRGEFQTLGVMKWSEAGSTLENMFIIRVDRCNPVTDIDGNKHDGGGGGGVETTRTRSVKGADGTKERNYFTQSGILAAWWWRSWCWSRNQRSATNTSQSFRSYCGGSCCEALPPVGDEAAVQQQEQGQQLKSFQYIFFWGGGNIFI